MGELDLNLQVSIWGLILGVVVGATAQKTNFCTMGAVSDAVFMEDWSRMRSWMLAVAVAILGAQGLHIAGLIDLYNTIF